MIDGVTADIWSDPPRLYKSDQNLIGRQPTSHWLVCGASDQTPMTIRLKVDESSICLVVGGSTASHGSVAGPWPVGDRNQRKVLGAIGG